MNAVDPRAVTAAELAATTLFCSVDTVYRLANTNKIPFIRVGRAFRFYPEDVKAKLSAPKPSWSQSAKSTGRRRAA